jgi:hypothetical protein
MEVWDRNVQYIVNELHTIDSESMERLLIRKAVKSTYNENSPKKEVCLAPWQSTSLYLYNLEYL